MKKILPILAFLLVFCPKSYAENDNITLLTKQGFFEKQENCSYLTPSEAIKKALFTHVKDANAYNLEGLKHRYAEDYINADGLNKEHYFDLIKKTWESYPDIKYRINIKNITINDDFAVAQVDEYAIGTTNSKSGIISEKGLLESNSSTIYYFGKINNEWLITSDYIIFEKTFLTYGTAKTMKVDLTAPSHMLANTQYTATLKIEPPKDSFVIASIGRENITYPQKVAEEVFRKLPDDNILERVFTSNNKNINEYSVASFGVTKAEINRGTEIKIYVTGLGFVMSRVNVTPKNDFIKNEIAKVEKNEKDK